ncbi:Patatin (plasmid) [Sulfuricurvum kujiense DSM 16994]|uniref:Patatin n=1 Tax=Sulfuricurvum kujiense (strain ATCC BAA-921 / DSM 16994 / JCM 11577 / YK-1) TaxID=709032 RepID=E4U3P0_SULKY|nr:patatin-like phospholipase family protein [Sulfuricurvum kujiense]ADR35306.1 Patatin [Sulfuricurvum kujiense DSM 16994]
MKTVSLVLGSGGARGYAHIGVIEEIERLGYQIVSISGSSMGALIGALYACGKIEEYKEWVIELKSIDLTKWLDISWNNRRGIFLGIKLMDKLSEMIGRINIEELPIKYTAVATDLNRNKEVWFQHGDLIDAVRASISIPFLLTPIQIDGMMLIDGGVLNPIPVAPTISDHSDLTIAVNLYADLLKSDIHLPDNVIENQSVIRGVVLKTQKSIVKEENVPLPILNVLEKTLDSIQRTLISYHLGGYPPRYIN